MQTDIVRLSNVISFPFERRFDCLGISSNRTQLQTIAPFQKVQMRIPLGEKVQMRILTTSCKLDLHNWKFNRQKMIVRITRHKHKYTKSKSSWLVFVENSNTYRVRFNFFVRSSSWSWLSDVILVRNLGVIWPQTRRWGNKR